MASMTSPEQGAQHECNNSLSAPFGSCSFGRSKLVIAISYLIQEIYGGGQCSIEKIALKNAMSFVLSTLINIIAVPRGLPCRDMDIVKVQPVNARNLTELGGINRNTFQHEPG